MIRNPRILFIDDDELVLKATQLYLKYSRVEAVFAKSGKHCLELLVKDHNYDLILLDLMLPDIDGLSVLKEIKNNSTWNKIPVIIQTGSTNFDASTIMKLGATIMGKPYSKNDLLKAIEWQMNNKK